MHEDPFYQSARNARNVHACEWGRFKNQSSDSTGGGRS